MSELRWVLLVLGLLLVAGVYLFWGRNLGLRRGSRNDGERLLSGERQEPSMGDESVTAFRRAIGADRGDPGTDPRDADGQGGHRGPHPAGSEPRPGVAQGDHSPPEQAEDSEPRKIVSLHVAARGSERFAGAEVVAALESEGLALGARRIFERMPARDGAPLFSVASMVEPGVFDLENISDTSLPGLTLFMVLPGPHDGAETFSEMLISARRLAQKLGGEVLDEQGSSLSNQTAGHIREEIIAFQLRRQALDDMRA